MSTETPNEFLCCGLLNGNLFGLPNALNGILVLLGDDGRVAIFSYITLVSLDPGNHILVPQLAVIVGNILVP